MNLHRSLAISSVVVLGLVAAACSDDDDASPATTAAPATTEPTTTLPIGDFMVQPGTNQVAATGLDPGTEVRLIAPDGTVAYSAPADEQGAILFREVKNVAGWTLTTDEATSEPFAVAGPDDVPPAELYTEQQTLLPAGGFGYIVTRDGTTLSANVVLPGPADEGPYPTVVEYSGYSPSNPGDTTFAQLYNLQGFAYVGVNMRGTGCSGGSYRFFETVQSLDGYDVIEAVAAQPWVLDNEVGMVGISYPGISQLFVAATQPPSLNSITPLSVIDDSYRSTLYPGGILNTGFAVEWTQQRVDEAAPYGQEWAEEMADDGDGRCADNQVLRLQNPDLVAEIDDNPFYTTTLGDALAPVTFVDRIEVPVFIAGAWQDEQTGGHFPAMLPEFTNAPHVYVTLANGLHTEALSPPIAERYFEFLQLYVGKRVPELAAANLIAPVLGGAIWGVVKFAPLDDRFAGMSYDEALAAFEGEAQVRVLFEQGGNAAFTPGTPEPNFVAEFTSWPVPEAEAQVWSLDGDGALTAADTASTPGEASYVADPAAISQTFYEGSGNDVWQADVEYEWQPLPDGKGLGFVTAPLADDTVVVGPGSVDLWISSSATDTDLEVTITEVRADGTEIYVQSGWLRASQRALDEAASSELRPVHTHLEADAAELPVGEFVPVRVELFPFAHPFRAGSRIRLTIDAPGGNRAVWQFRTISAGETVTVAFDADRPSRVVLSVVPVNVGAPAPPACGALRGQPCRDYVEATNGG